MAYTVKLQNGITDNIYLYDKTYSSIDEIYDDMENIKKGLAPEISMVGILKLAENKASETASDKKHGLTNKGKGYKIRFHNALTGENTLSNEVYDTPEAAEEAWEKAFLAGEIPSDIACGGIFSIDNSEPKYDLTDDGKGKKYDNGKSMVGTLCRVFPRAMLGVGQCIEFGTHKYPDPKNWVKVENAFNRYQDSMMRHYLKFLAGQEKDSETKLLHLKHMVWNALAVLELYLMGNEDETLFD